MLDVLLGLGGAVAPYLIDEISGASRGRRKAKEKQDQLFQEILNETEQEIGADTEQSGIYKMGIGQLNKGLQRATDVNTQVAATGGLTNEAQLGRMQGTNEAFAGAHNELLKSSIARRQELKNLKRRLQLQRSGMEVDLAEQDSARMAQLGSGLGQIAPQLFDVFGGGETEKPRVRKKATSLLRPNENDSVYEMVN